MEAKLREDLKKAQLLANELQVQTLRLLLSEMKNLQISRGQDLTDQDINSVVQKEIKKRKESSRAFRDGNREELAQREEAEAAILATYLPEQMSEKELTQVVENAIKELGASTIQDIGKVIGQVRAKVGQGADGETISRIVKEKLS